MKKISAPMQIVGSYKGYPLSYRNYSHSANTFSNQNPLSLFTYYTNESFITVANMNTDPN